MSEVGLSGERDLGDKDPAIGPQTGMGMTASGLPPLGLGRGDSTNRPLGSLAVGNASHVSSGMARNVGAPKFGQPFVVMFWVLGCWICEKAVSNGVASRLEYG